MQFLSHLKDLPNNYPYMFARDGRMIMWGRSITYRMGTAIPLALTGLLHDSEINYGWMRRIASSTILQFLEHPDFLKERLPTLGFYGAFEPAVQTYSCRGSAFWLGKLFLALYLPADNIFQNAKENEGAWKKFKSQRVYNKYAKKANILISNYPKIGAAEIRSTASSKNVGVYQGTENYNRLSYHSAFPWQADSKGGAVAMNYVVKNKDDQWEALRIFRFKKYEDGFYCREAVLVSNPKIKFQLAEMMLPNGILRIDKVSTPFRVEMRLGHYALPEKGQTIKEIVADSERNSYIIDNGIYQLAMINWDGWESLEFVRTRGLHPESEYSKVINASGNCNGDKVYITLLLWNKSGQKFAAKELNPIKNIDRSPDGVCCITLKMGNK